MKTFCFDRSKADPGKIRKAGHTVMPTILDAPGQEQIRECLAVPKLQAKLAISSPTDPCERETDRIAERVAGTSAMISTKQSEPADTLKITPQMEKSLAATKGGGSPIMPDLRIGMENSLGSDFSDVRIHNDSRADTLNQQLNALAFTTGKDIYFRKGEYDPEGNEGKKLLTHELVHVGQMPESCSLIKRWSLSDHSEFTKAALVRMLMKHLATLKYELNKSNINLLSNMSATMDLIPCEILFNFAGQCAESDTRLDQNSNHETVTRSISIPEIRRDLRNYYSTNKEHAQNHGEGGLYSMPHSEARTINQNTIQKYLQQFKNSPTGNLQSKFRLFWFLGQALHVAQDRQAHGEGAKGKGHDLEVMTKGWNPDDRTANSFGWELAKIETDVVLAEAFNLHPTLSNFFINPRIDISDIIRNCFESFTKLASDKGLQNVPVVKTLRGVSDRGLQNTFGQKSDDYNAIKDPDQSPKVHTTSQGLSEAEWVAQNHGSPIIGGAKPYNLRVKKDTNHSPFNRYVARQLSDTERIALNLKIQFILKNEIDSEAKKGRLTTNQIIDHIRSMVELQIGNYQIEFDANGIQFNL